MNSITYQRNELIAPLGRYFQVSFMPHGVGYTWDVGYIGGFVVSMSRLREAAADKASVPVRNVRLRRTLLLPTGVEYVVRHVDGNILGTLYVDLKEQG